MQKSTAAKRLKTRLVAVGQVLFYNPFRDHHSDNVWDPNGLFVANCYGAFSEWQILYNLQACYE